MMTIYVNNETCEVPDGATIADALKARNITPRNGMALAVNTSIVPQPQWAEYPLSDKDKIMLITATQGG